MQVSAEVQEILNAAYKDARERNHEYLTPEHVLYASMHYPYPREVMNECGADSDELRDELSSYLEENIPQLKESEPAQSKGFQNVIERAVIHTHHVNREVVESGDVLVSLFEEEESFGAYFMKKQGVTRGKLLEIISHTLGRSQKDMEDRQYEEDSTDSDDGNPEEVFEGEPEQNRGKKRRALDQFATDLIEAANKKELEPLIGRGDILERTMQVLCRRLKNNPVHIGPPGVGKTAITEGLAQLIASGNVPDLLKEYKLYSLDLGAIVAGTRYRGDFEERIKQVLKELSQLPKVIIFIDELHTLVGTGAASGGAMDASNLLKPALASGKLRVIGATTPEEYRRFIEKDHALARRFQAIDVPEPKREEAIAILKGLRPKYEDFHNVQYTDEALESAVSLSDQFINERYLPDKAIDVIDECGALEHLRNFKLGDSTEMKVDDQVAVKDRVKDAVFVGDGGEGPEDPEQDLLDKNENEDSNQNDDSDSGTNSNRPIIDQLKVEEVISKIAKIPAKSVNTNEKEKLKSLEPALKKVIFGQDSAIHGVVEAVKRSRAGFRKADKPVANFLFVGPTGVGKTELARQLAEYMGVELIRFDMSEYQERHTVSRLIGSPPGYVGYEEGGQLTEAIRKTPHAVLLLDEIEKAHSDIFNILLQVMDYAKLTDNNGRQADFRNVILIMTSNAGARDLGRPIIGFGDKQMDASIIDDAVSRAFTPEFRNRLDRVVQFGGLHIKTVENIVRKEINEFQKQLEEKEIEIIVSDPAVKFLAEKGYSKEFGARNIARLVDDEIRAVFIDVVLFGELKDGGSAHISVKNSRVHMKFKAAPEKPKSDGPEADEAKEE